MKKVLIVDDDSEILNVVRILLERHGFLVETLPGVSKIYRKVIQFEPTLIILDIGLKDGDGRNTCKDLKESKLTSHIPILLFSADNNKIKEFKEYKADGVIEKPFEPKELVTFINKFF